jgi:hypothetical protein
MVFQLMRYTIFNDPYSVLKRFSKFFSGTPTFQAFFPVSDYSPSVIFRIFCEFLRFPSTLRPLPGLVLLKNNSSADNS